MTPGPQRLEELGLNSCAPPGQLLYDGWLLRLAAGAAKRARSVNAVYPSQLPLDEKIAHCERIYRAAGLPAIFRMTPFSEPADLDAALERHGYRKFETTAVECAAIAADIAPDSRAEPMELAAWVDTVGEIRNSPVAHRAIHLARLQAAPLATRSVVVRHGGRPVATGLAIVEDDCVGLFDIVTREGARRQGCARAIVATLLDTARRELGARHAYLQVRADNAPARALYRRFGFTERYAYWYRGRNTDPA